MTLNYILRPTMFGDVCTRGLSTTNLAKWEEREEWWSLRKAKFSCATTSMNSASRFISSSSCSSPEYSQVAHTYMIVQLPLTREAEAAARVCVGRLSSPIQGDHCLPPQGKEARKGASKICRSLAQTAVLLIKKIPLIQL